jgi:hypothetical protein
MNGVSEIKISYVAFIETNDSSILLGEEKASTINRGRQLME